MDNDDFYGPYSNATYQAIAALTPTRVRVWQDVFDDALAAIATPSVADAIMAHSLGVQL